MATLNLTVANDIASAVLFHYARGPALVQTMQDKPLLAFLNANKKTFPGGNLYLSDPVQGQFMSDTAGFFAGYSEDESLSFAQASNLLRAEYRWYEVHAGLIITWTELKKDGITITDNQKKSEHADIALDRLTSLLENRMDDYGESWSRSMNLMFWKDGSQDAKQVPGVLSLITEAPNAGITGGLNRATYAWWRNRAKLGIQVNAVDQTMTEVLRAEKIQLGRYGGKPNKALCGSDWLAGMRKEVQAKGLYTQSGFKGKNDISMDSLSLDGIGNFEYDPTLDELGLSKYCYFFDSRRIKMRPMEGEDNKVMVPERPYNYMVFLKSMTWTGTLQVTQMNAHEVMSIA